MENEMSSSSEIMNLQTILVRASKKGDSKIDHSDSIPANSELGIAILERFDLETQKYAGNFKDKERTNGDEIYMEGTVISLRYKAITSQRDHYFPIGDFTERDFPKQIQRTVTYTPNNSK